LYPEHFTGEFFLLMSKYLKGQREPNENVLRHDIFESDYIVTATATSNKMASFAQQLLLAWEALQDLSRDGAFTVDGHSLTVPQVVAISQSASRVDINQSVRDRISASITGLQDHLTVGNVVYGVNTGFGCAIITSFSLLGLR
jgi:hypothetical protein